VDIDGDALHVGLSRATPDCSGPPQPAERAPRLR
jgi:hypothetical protein